MKAILASMLIAAIGIVFSILGIFLMRAKEHGTLLTLLSYLGNGVNTRSVSLALA